MNWFKKAFSLSFEKDNIKITIVIALSFIALYYFLTVLSFYYSMQSWDFRMLFTMQGTTYAIFYILAGLIIAFLFGMNLSLLIYQFKLNKKIKYKEGSQSIFGSVLSAISSGCPACGSLLAVFGITSGLSIFPLKGFELKILAISLLLLSTYFLVKRIDAKCENCR